MQVRTPIETVPRPPFIDFLRDQNLKLDFEHPEIFQQYLLSTGVVLPVIKTHDPDVMNLHPQIPAIDILVPVESLTSERKGSLMLRLHIDHLVGQTNTKTLLQWDKTDAQD